jgi:uroporphyrinogen III methyltransferase/synthase
MRDDLLRLGAREVDDVPVYRTVPVNYSGGSVIAGLDPEAVDLVTFTSSSTVRNYRSIVMQDGNSGFLRIPCAAIGPVTANTARDEGFTVVIEAEEYTIDGLVDAICGYYSPNK